MSWLIDNSHTTIEFSVKHLVFSKVKGRFEKFSGNINWDEENFPNSSVEVTIEAGSINTHDEQRDVHLKSAEFFDIEKFTTLSFKSTKIEKIGKAEYKLIGNLTIHGVTREETFEVEYLGKTKNPWNITSAGFSAKTSIDRKDYGLTWNVGLEAGGVLVGEKVKISLDIELVNQAPVEAKVATAV